MSGPTRVVKDTMLGLHMPDIDVWSERVVTGLGQVREPVYSRSVGRWRRYERHLGPLFEALGDRVPG